jgi:hypothetical protein
VHIVGLGFDIHDPRVAEGLQSTRGGRHARAQDMAAGLAKVGIHGSFEGALTYAGFHPLRPLLGGNRCL